MFVRSDAGPLEQSSYQGHHLAETLQLSVRKAKSDLHAKDDPDESSGNNMNNTAELFGSEVNALDMSGDTDELLEAAPFVSIEELSANVTNRSKHSQLKHTSEKPKTGKSSQGAVLCPENRRGSEGSIPSVTDSSLEDGEIVTDVPNGPKDGSHEWHLDSFNESAMQRELRHLETMTAKMQLSSSTPATTHVAPRAPRPRLSLNRSHPSPRRSAPGDRASTGSLGITEGSYSGACRHRDGNELGEFDNQSQESRLFAPNCLGVTNLVFVSGILYQVKRVTVEDGKTLFCLWVSLDPDDPCVRDLSHSRFNITLASSFSSSRGASLLVPPSAKDDASTEASSQVSTQMLPLWCQHVTFSLLALQNTSKDASKSVPSSVPTSVTTSPAHSSGTPQTDELDNYDANYETLDSIGKGAFGFVKLARQKRTGKEVVVKFIRKAKVLKDCWITDDVLGHVPLEVSLLSKLQHPNIVAVSVCLFLCL